MRSEQAVPGQRWKVQVGLIDWLYAGYSETAWHANALCRPDVHVEVDGCCRQALVTLTLTQGHSVFCTFPAAADGAPSTPSDDANREPMGHSMGCEENTVDGDDDDDANSSGEDVGTAEYWVD